MDTISIARSSISKKLLITSLLCITGLTYLSLVVHIWIDTEFRPSLVAESYGYMEYIELTDHAHFYLPYYALFLFAIPVGIMMFSSFSENVKSFFAVVPFVIIIIDIASMYLIPYLWTGFAMVLWLAGTCLGTLLFVLIMMLFYDVWLRKA